ncbi:hypothetical protein [Novilysobacter spongiicola]|uniref:Uncharacterized protein n=1 Tax=Lysobacter spongiicola DSM 21749 TaxID=1122188 RepID=A0A1T4N7W3_9GAMM|nr:hypothetical protein [Lysobacter spongiicola]SJZ75370.1 hypothetical protein SAMN02745674_00769 [Lysobacter spongiicola DSM 21749]
MALTLGLTGMDATTEASLKDAFNEANARLGGAWQLQPETQAEFVVVDMDSMYGPMSWLRLHAAGKTVIGLTSAPRTQADFRLSQPFDTGSVARLLQELAPGEAGADTAIPSGLTPSPVPQDQLPEERARPDEEADPSLASTEETTSPEEPPSAAVAKVVPAAPTVAPHTPPRPAAPAPEAEPKTLAEWLARGRIAGRVRLERDGTPLLIDARQRQYHGPAALKPLSAHVSDTLVAADFQQPDDAGWDREAATLGAGQPLSRLVWFGGLLAGKGELMQGFDPEARYQMLKWPQTEREYPKHFRIATVMMKGPATLPDIAEASGVPLADVTDFVNASLATGFADVEHLPEPTPEPQKPTGLFGRLRGR